MFVDACAIVSMFVGEPDAAAYNAALEYADHPITSPLAMWEAVVVLARPEKLDTTFEMSLTAVRLWIADRGIALQHPSTTPDHILDLAVEVASRHGLGKKRLNVLDCFHYAHARAAGVPILTNDRLLRATDVATAP